MKVVFIGAGNLATRLSLAMQRAGMTVAQVYSHTEASACRLAERLACRYTTDLKEIEADADLYVFSLKDAVLQEVIARFKPVGGLCVHTAGSMPMYVFEGYAKRYGVLYPLQTFSKEREVDFRPIPLFLEANTEEDADYLHSVAGRLSDNVRFLSSDKRRTLHLAGVFACNFANHIYALAGRLLEEQGVEREVLLPLTDETAAKIHVMTPHQAQTGPAIRYDQNVIDKHLAMLADPDMRAIYELMSQSIHKEAQR